MHAHDHLPLEDLRRLARAIPAKRLWKRHQAIILATQGQDATAIAVALRCGVRSVQSWVKQYNEHGPDALREGRHTGRPPRISGPELARFKGRVEAGPTPEDGRATFYGQDIRRILEAEFGAKLCLQAIHDLLHRQGLSSLMPRPQHKDADDQLQASFKEVVAEQIRATRDARPDQEVQVWFEGEARFGQQGTMAGVWARKGSRPRAVKQTRYGYPYVLTAVCAATGMASGLIASTLDIGVVNIFLRRFSEELPSGVHAVLIRDGAGSHTSPRLVVPANVSPIRLVPYSPELNPVENLWHYLGSHHWSSRVYADHEALEGAAMDAWRRVCLVPELVRSICAAPYVDAKDAA